MISDSDAGIAQLVEHDLAKVGVASSSLVSRSSLQQNLGPPGFCFLRHSVIFPVTMRRQWPGGRVVMQRPAKPCTPVRFRPWPPLRRFKKPAMRGLFVARMSGIRAAEDAECQPRTHARMRRDIAGGAHRTCIMSLGPDGETGIRKGLKIPQPKGYAGSTPAPGTMSSSCSLADATASVSCAFVSRAAGASVCATAALRGGCLRPSICG